MGSALVPNIAVLFIAKKWLRWILLRFAENSGCLSYEHFRETALGTIIVATIKRLAPYPLQLAEANTIYFYQEN